MSSEGQEGNTFDAIRQFTVAPDRRYRIEQHDSALRFCRTGSQFDAQWLVRGARSLLGDRIAGAFERASGTRLLFGGVGLAAAAALLLVLIGFLAADTTVTLRRSHVTGIGVLVFAFIVGLVLIIAGLSTRRDGAAGDGCELSLPLADIVDASLLPPQSELARRGEPQVARLHLQPRRGKAIRLGIPTEADLQTVKRAIPRLAA